MIWKRKCDQSVQEAIQELGWKLTVITRLMLAQARQGERILASIQDLFDAVESETSVDESILALVDQLVALVKAAGVDPAKLDAALATVAANKAKIVEKVNANTPQP